MCLETYTGLLAHSTDRDEENLVMMMVHLASYCVLIQIDYCEDNLLGEDEFYRIADAKLSPPQPELVKAFYSAIRHTTTRK